VRHFPGVRTMHDLRGGILVGRTKVAGSGRELKQHVSGIVEREGGGDMSLHLKKRVKTIRIKSVKAQRRKLGLGGVDGGPSRWGASLSTVGSRRHVCSRVLKT